MNVSTKTTKVIIIEMSEAEASTLDRYLMGTMHPNDEVEEFGGELSDRLMEVGINSEECE